MTDNTTEHLPDIPSLAEQYAASRRQRVDGWTPEKQREFLEKLAEGHTVDAACYYVGMNPSGAYALRNRASGRVFALGWDAAARLARQKFADTLVSRALEGCEETYTRPDGTTYTRHRFDNRLAMAMLARLDKRVDAQEQDAARADGDAARLIAQDFESFLDLVEAGEGPSRVGVFLCGRAAEEAALGADLAAFQGLARADRWLRGAGAAACDVEVGDLDLTRRAEWTADQWRRAEAAGLIAFTAPDEAAEAAQDEAQDEARAEAEALEALEAFRNSPLSLLKDEEGFAHIRLWCDDAYSGWRTDFPPPPGFDGTENGAFGDETYWRTLSRAEQAVVDAWDERDHARKLARWCAARDLYFGFAPEDDEEAQAGEERTMH